MYGMGDLGLGILTRLEILNPSAAQYAVALKTNGGLPRGDAVTRFVESGAKTGREGPSSM